jgi:hypothetical protein
MKRRLCPFPSPFFPVVRSWQSSLYHERVSAMSMPPGPQAIAAPTEQMRELTADASELEKMSADPNVHPGMGERLWGFQARLRPDVTYEEFTHWAKIEREMEEV